MKKCLLAAAFGIIVAAVVVADDVPTFRGADRSGVSKETGLLKAWPKGGPKLAWTFKDAGLGFSTVAVVKGVVYTLGTDAKITGEYVIAINEKDGKELWRHKIGPLYTYQGNTYGDGPRSTPTIDGNSLYALGGTGNLVCIDVAAKKQVWSKNLATDLGGAVMSKYGYSESPLVDGDLVLCTPGGAKGTLAALDKKTGEVKWRSKGLTNLAPYSSIVVAEFGKVRQYVQMSYVGTGKIHGEVSGIDAKSGDLLWTAQIFKNENEGIGATPVVSGNQVYVTVGFGGGCHLFDISVAGGKFKAVDKYSKSTAKKVKSTFGGMVLIDGYLYGHSERDMWVCQEFKTGEVKWDNNVDVKGASGGITAAEGKLYLFSDEGEVGLADADPAAFKLISSFTLPMRSALSKGRTTSRMAKVWTYPVIANGRLYLRDNEFIFAYELK